LPNMAEFVTELCDARSYICLWGTHHWRRKSCYVCHEFAMLWISTVMRQQLPESRYDLTVVPSLHAIEYEDLKKFGLTTNRKPKTLSVSNVARYVQALLKLLLSSGKSRLKELSAERGGMLSNEALLNFKGLLTPRKEVPRIYPSVSRYVSLQPPSRSLLMNACSVNLRY